MAVSVSYQTWASGSYNWLDTTTSSAAPQQINNLLSSWVTAVNGNAANTNKQITVIKSPASSTSANFVGWVIQAASNSTNSTFITRIYSSSTTNLVCTFSESFNDSGANGGYGATSGVAATDSTVTWATSGVTAEFIVATETDNEKEFFALGWRLGGDSTNRADLLLIYKDTAGEWAGWFYDSADIGCFYMPTHSTAQRCFSAVTQSLTNSSTIERFALRLSASSTQLATAGSEMTVQSVAASPDIFRASLSGSVTNFGRWATLAGGKTLIGIAYAPFFVSYTP